MNSQTNNQFEQVEDFDTDDSDLSLTPALRPYNRNHQHRDTSCTTKNLVSLSQTLEFDYGAETVRIIPSHAGIVQAVKRLKRSCIKEGGQEGVMPTQECIRKLRMWVMMILLVVRGLARLSTVSGTIHYKVITDGNGNAITVGAALILHNVFVFFPKPSAHYLTLH
uniref:Homologous recombination OB-fold protein OB-fold domain-containing protein n=1 Tax=Tanacetum cinerariifolium TaxID=118510 RepID=A0A6L2JSJ2_TANCI|nr:hypothetical protein [Tanacetum cinerariifolium]